MRVSLFAFICALLVSLCLPLTALAQSVADADAITVEQLQAQLDEIPASSKDNADLQQLTTKLSKIQQNAQSLLNQVTQQVVDLNDKLNRINTPAGAAKTEAPDSTEATSTEATKSNAGPEAAFIDEQRSALQSEHDKLDAQRKHLILIISAAEEKRKLLINERRQRFKAELSLKVRSMLNPSFWRNWSLAMSTDAARIQAFKNDLSALATEAINKENRWPLVTVILLSIFAFVFINRYVNQSLNYALITIIPNGRARRSFYALAKLLLRVLLMGLVCLLVYLGLNWNDILNPELKRYLQQIFYAMLLASFIYGMGEAMLCLKHDTWRLTNLSGDEARALSPYPTLLALLTLSYQIVTISGNYIGTSFTTELSVNTLATFLTCLLSFSFFTRLSRGGKPLNKKIVGSKTAAEGEPTEDTTPAEEETNPKYPFWFVSLTSIAWLLSLVAIIITLTGYVSMASFIVNQLVWTVLVSSAFYIAWKLADDLYHALLGNKALLGNYLIRAYAISDDLINQFIVVLSAITKVLLIYALIRIILLPFGTNITEFSNFSAMLNRLVAEHNFALSTSGIISAIFIFIIGFWLIKIFKTWLDKKYFPNTKLEKGVQSSISTMSGYLGGVLVIALILGALGLSFDKITWVASALSVGIGFGLQSIVQNFISGLILLTERPVKVGDWVVVGNNDGDIKRINIRATEIQLFDRSTLIVPNSEFITKAVRNMTLDNSGGRIQIKLPLPINTNPRIVADMVLAVMAEHESVLEDSEPYVRLDAIDTSGLILTATCYVPSARMVGKIRSELLFEILDRLHQAEINLISPVPVDQIGGGGSF
ncbi:DUF3772 domain-containing protein [Oligella urethralis]|uniref:DUF3772 domain-containing protein n=1 Tax=Oligella urethralis TaxID=90245 RepID=UPI00035D0BF9|nr:DUF3772 domain-containing protein [Oligella urethralis]SUA66327.1 Potassium efflux system KefA precursor [Oligella urethralis]